MDEYDRLPLIDAVVTTPSNTLNSGFVVELASDGGSALFSSYLNGVNSGVSTGGYTPAMAVDSQGICPW